MCWQTPLVWCRTVLRPLCQLDHTTLPSPVPQLRFWLLSTWDQPAHPEDSSLLVSMVPFRVRFDPFDLAADLNNAKVSTTISDYDQRSKISTTVLLYIYMISGFKLGIWHFFGSNQGCGGWLFSSLPSVDLSYCLKWLFLFWFDRLSASASKHKKFINQIRFCSVWIVKYAISKVLHFIFVK